MTLDSGGRLLLGRTSSDANNFRFQISQSTDTYGSGIELTYSGVGSAGIWENSSGALCFGNDNASGTTERARITSGGDFLYGSASNLGAGFKVAITSGGSSLAVKTGLGGYAFAGYNNGGAITFIVQDNGNVTNSNNSYGAISDAKLKDNIVDAKPKLADLMQVKVRNYNLKSDPDHKHLGVIAQELEQVFPSMVDESVDCDEEGNNLGTTTKSVKYSVFVPMLIKAIQEQQAIITQLQADVAALKGNA
jgi:hypothetical protein